MKIKFSLTLLLRNYYNFIVGKLYFIDPSNDIFPSHLVNPSQLLAVASHSAAPRDHFQVYRLVPWSKEQ